jgi:hypothetical protein
METYLRHAVETNASTGTITHVDYEDLRCPFFVCCACGGVIDEGGQAMVEWIPAKRPLVWRVRHKSYVCRESRLLDLREKSEGGSNWWWDEMATFLQQIARNTLGSDWAEKMKGARSL